MTDRRSGRLSNLFDRVIAAPARERAALIERACAGQPELGRRLQAMIAESERERVAAPHGSEGPGTRIGPYTLVQSLGEGGFGSVFLAEQEKPVARKVALKIIKLGMDTRQVIARFEQERQALAMMDHPNIARVLDAGTTEAGRPYFVMDFVPGKPIADYCDENNLSIGDRLELFAQVCTAVQHAHTKGIIHRDLKPSNVLVSTEDGRPHARVIDFGIAKATSRKLIEETLRTELHQVVGTLEYMSPEQAEGSLDIDTRTDVYSLGVLLYELLTGSTPFDAKTLRSAMYGEIQRIIREVDPPRPSTRLTRSADVLASIAARRRVEPRRLGSIVRGELDWIVMKALEKDRRRRYESASAFAADVRRYLGGEAVAAAPPSAAYRMRKFLHRNRGAVAAGAAVAAALLIGAVGFAWQAHRAGIERDGAIEARKGEEREREKADRLAEAEAAQRVAAERSEKKAAAINEFLLDMLGSADIRELGREAKVAQALDRAATDVGTAFEDRPEVEAAIRQILGKTYLSLGLVDRAEPHVDAALELSRLVFGEESAEYAKCLGNRGFLRGQRGDPNGAVESHGRAAAIAEKAKGPEDALTLGLKGDHANSLMSAGRLEEAEKILRETLEVRTRAYGRESRDTLMMINGLAVTLHHLERLDEAEALYREAFEIGARTRGKKHPDTLIAQLNYASLLESRGKFAEAEPLMKEAHGSFASVFGESSVKTASATKVLGELYEAQGRFKDALPLLEESVAILRRTQGDSTLDVAAAKEKLARLSMRMSDTARAATVQAEAVDVLASLTGKESARTLAARRQLADVLATGGRHEEAEKLYEDVIATSRRVLGGDDPTTFMAAQGFGVLLMRREKYADAEPFVREGLDSGRRVDGPDHPNTLIAQFNLSVIWREVGRLDEAEALSRDTIERSARAFGAEHPNVATMRANYADTLVALGRMADARRELEEAVAIVEAKLGPRNVTPAGYRLQLARLSIDAGDLDGAESILDDVIDVFAGASGPRDRRTANARLERGRCLTRRGRFAEAEALLSESHAILVEARPAGHPEIRRAERYLADLYAAWSAAEPDSVRAEKAAEWKAKVEAAR